MCKPQETSPVNQSELVWLHGRENSYAFSLKLADATRFIFGTMSDEQPCTHLQRGAVSHHPPQSLPANSGKSDSDFSNFYTDQQATPENMLRLLTPF